MTINVEQLIYSKGSAQWKTTYSKICLLQSLEWLLEKTEIYLESFFPSFQSENHRQSLSKSITKKKS